MKNILQHKFGKVRKTRRDEHFTGAQRRKRKYVKPDLSSREGGGEQEDG